MISKLLPFVPEHRTYVEPFCGAASLLWAKPPAAVETINDLDSGVYGFFKVLRDQPDEFMRLARLTEYGRELYNECRENWQQEQDPVRRAWMWWVVAATSFSGNWGSTISTAITASDRGMAAACSTFLSRIDEVLPACIERIRRVQIEHMDAVYVMERYCTEDGFCYADPPYVGETRGSHGYSVDMRSTDKHEQLVRSLLEVPGAVLLSGYRHAVYEPLEDAGWERIDWETSCYAAGRTRATGIQGEGAAMRMQRRVESVWLNPELQKRLGRMPFAAEEQQSGV